VRAADLRRVRIRGEVGGIRCLHTALTGQSFPELALQVVLTVGVGREGRALGVSRLRTFG
jgi:hypothetical protein